VPVLILRVSQLHVGVRANPSGFHTFKRSVGSFGTYSTILTYVFASLVFISLYLLSSTKGDKLSFIVDGKYGFQMPPFWNARQCIDKFYRTYERPRLNERFIYLVYSASHVGLVQGILHIYRDRGRLEFPDVNVSRLLQSPPEIVPN
jgi:nucleoporin NDC1